MKNEIRKTWHFDQAPGEVWEYLTKPELMELWLMKNDFKPIVGHKFRFTFDETDKNPYVGRVECEVLEVMPFSKLSYSWHGATRDGSRTFNTVVEWTLVPKNKGTELRLSHNGFTAMEDVLAHSGGWDSCIKKIQDSINSHTK